MWSEFSFTKNRVTSWSASGARPLMKNSVSNADTGTETEQQRLKVITNVSYCLQCHSYNLDFTQPDCVDLFTVGKMFLYRSHNIHVHLSQCADKVTVILPDSSHFYHITHPEFSKSGSHSVLVFLSLFLLYFVFHVTTVDACFCLYVVNCFFFVLIVLGFTHAVMLWNTFCNALLLCSLL